MGEVIYPKIGSDRRILQASEFLLSGGNQNYTDFTNLTIKKSSKSGKP
jgi:hypothetical protein